MRASPNEVEDKAVACVAAAYGQGKRTVRWPPLCSDWGSALMRGAICGNLATISAEKTRLETERAHCKDSSSATQL